MSSLPADAGSGDKTQGLIERTLGRLFLRATQVAEVRTLSPSFRLIDLEGSALQGVNWAPGDKLQVKVASPLITRTFTPIRLDTRLGRTCILGYAHGAGPGSGWVRSASAGDECQVFGPRRSLSFNGMTGPVVLFGDETSFGLAAALSGVFAGAQLRCVFEVTSQAESALVLEALNIHRAELIERDDAPQRVQAVDGFSGADSESTRYVLTGKAQSIQLMKRALTAQGIPSSRVMVKAYWSPGKTGLD